jgi:hypothetical protein
LISPVSEVVGLRARHEPERRGTRLRVGDAIDDALGVSPVLGAVHGVDPVVDRVIDVLDRNVLLDAVGPDAALVTRPRDAMPASAGPVCGADIQSSPARTTQIGTAFRSVPSRRSGAISSSCAASILLSSPLVQLVVSAVS